jgi:hypothetical protein
MARTLHEALQVPEIRQLACTRSIAAENPSKS